MTRIRYHAVFDTLQSKPIAVSGKMVQIVLHLKDVFHYSIVDIDTGNILRAGIGKDVAELKSLAKAMLINEFGASFGSELRNRKKEVDSFKEIV